MSKRLMINDGKNKTQPRTSDIWPRPCRRSNDPESAGDPFRRAAPPAVPPCLCRHPRRPHDGPHSGPGQGVLGTDAFMRPRFLMIGRLGWGDRCCQLKGCREVNRVPAPRLSVPTFSECPRNFFLHRPFSFYLGGWFVLGQRFFWVVL